MNGPTLAQTPKIPALPPAPLQTGLLQRKCACGGSPGVDGECAECRAKRLSLQRRASSPVSPTPAVPPIVHDVLSSPGQPLDARTRAFMEPRFGHDFSNVRVHSDAKAAESARTVNALAYTVGRNVVFGAGRYAPGTSVGKKLMAHELTHVVQQRKSAIANSDIHLGSADNGYEAEAELMANKIVQQNDSIISSGNVPNISKDIQPTVRRWKITGNIASADREGDFLGNLATKVGAHFNDWKCIKPVSMKTFKFSHATEHQKKHYELFVQIGDTFDISNLTTTEGPTLRVYLFNDNSQASDVEIGKLFYPGSVSSPDADADIESKATSGSTPIKNFLIFGHASGGLMYGDGSRFDPTTDKPEEPKQSFELAHAGFFPRRCWFTRGANARSVGCDSETWGENFAASYLRKGASITTTTKAVGSWCSSLKPGETICRHPDNLFFAAYTSRSAPIVGGPFSSAGAFHASKFWRTIQGKL